MKSNCEECEHWISCELKIIIHNPIKRVSIDSYNQQDDVYLSDDFTINKGDRIAQVILLEHHSNLFNITSDVERVSGFGSSGV